MNDNYNITMKDTIQKDEQIKQMKIQEDDYKNTIKEKVEMVNDLTEKLHSVECSIKDYEVKLKQNDEEAKKLKKEMSDKIKEFTESRNKTFVKLE